MNKKSPFFLLRMAGAVLPLLVFVGGALTLAIYKCPDEKGYWPIALAALTLAVLLAKDKRQAVNIAVAGMSQRLVPLMVCAWLFSAILGQYMRVSGMIPVLVEFLRSLHVSGGVFVGIAFIVASIAATCTGTAVGTILMVTPVMFPLGAETGANPTLLLGALLAGGAFGDDYSPLSDTTIASAETQGVDPGESVLVRFKYVIGPALAALTLYVFIGGGGHPAPQQTTTDAQHWSRLLMLAAPVLVLVLSKMGADIIVAMLSGIVCAVVLGINTGAVPADRLFGLDKENFTATSIIIDGMNRAVGISVFTMLLVGTVEIVLHTLSREVVRSVAAMSARKAEALITLMIIGVNTFLAHNTVTILATSAATRNLRDRGGLNGMRVSQLVDIAGNTVMHMFPYMITTVLAIALARPDLSRYGVDALNPIAVGFSNFHSWGLLVCLAVVIVTGRWRGEVPKVHRPIGNEATGQGA
jgi:Na+/H+ antiporter NhaC